MGLTISFYCNCEIFRQGITIIFDFSPIFFNLIGYTPEQMTRTWRRREQQLQGVYGELLRNRQKLKVHIEISTNHTDREVQNARVRSRAYSRSCLSLLIDRTNMMQDRGGQSLTLDSALRGGGGEACTEEKTRCTSLYMRGIRRSKKS